MSQNEKKIKTKEEGKESKNQFYSHLNKIYKEIDEEGEIYTEGFTPEQIYYQIEEVSEKILKEAKKKIKIKESKGKVKKGEEGNSTEKDEIEERHEDNQDDRNDNNQDGLNEEEDNGNEEEDSGSESINEYSDNPSPLVIENIGTDYSDCSSVDEETYSEDSTPFDPEEMKSKPASELFKTLDKNIRRK